MWLLLTQTATSFILISAYSILLVDMASEFEKLPLQKDMDLMRNILYGGIWTRYNLKTQARAGKERRR